MSEQKQQETKHEEVKQQETKHEELTREELNKVAAGGNPHKFTAIVAS